MLHILLAPLFLAPGPQVQSEDSTERLLRAIPREAIGILATARWEDIRQRVAQNAWTDFLGDDSWGQACKELDRLIGREVGPVAALVDVPAILEAIDGPVVAGFTIGRFGWEALALVDAGTDAPEIEQLFAFAWGAIEENEPSCTAIERDGISLLFACDDPTRESHAIFEVDGVFGWIAHQDGESLIERAHEVIEHLEGKSEAKGFLDSDAYHRARRGLSRTPALQVVFNGDSFFRAMAQELDDEELGHVTEIGVFDIGWGFVNMDLGAGEELDCEAAIAVPRDTLLGDLADLMGSVPTHLIDRLPPESTNITLANYDVHGAWQLLLGALEGFEPGVVEKIEGTLRGVHETWDIDVEEDLLVQLTGNFAGFSVPVPEGESAAQFEALGLEDNRSYAESSGFLCELADPYTVEDALEKALLITGIAGMVEEGEFEDGSLYQKVPLGQQPLLWTFTADSFLYSTSETPLRGALARSEEGDAGPDHLARFRQVLKRSGPETGVITISDTRATVSATLSLLGMLEQLGPLLNSDRGWYAFSALDFPDSELASAYFQGTIVQTISHSKDGLHLSIRAR